MKSEKKIHFYYVDETGDLTLFDKKGNVIVGTEGVSSFFMVGVAHIFDPAAVSEKIEDLRKQLLDDPYFSGVPSMRADTKKTARLFHAKDDLPEVRREVFRLLGTLDIKVQAVIRRKAALANEAKRLFSDYGIKLHPHDVYDDLIKRLFRNLLHKADENRIIIAQRGKTSRLEALQTAVEKARRNFNAKYGSVSDNCVKIFSAKPDEFGGLQVIDYFLWALQRLYERGEDRFFNLLERQYRLIIDLDDKRNKTYGEYYSDQNPLTVKKIKPSTG